MGLDRRQWRDVPDHRQGPILRVQREGDAPFDRHLVGRRTLGRLDPVIWNAISASPRGNFGIVGIEEKLELRLVKVLRILHARCVFDPIRIVKQHTEIANASDASFRTNRGLPCLNPRIAEDALFRLARSPVVINFLVWTSGDTHSPTTTLVLVDEDNAVLLTLVNRARRAGSDAARIEAMLAKTRQIHHEGIFELAVNVLLHSLKIVILRALVELAAENLLPVRSPFNFRHRPAADER